MKLCLTLATSSEDRLARQIRKHAGHVDLIEVRLDALLRRWLPPLPETATRFIATCRPVREGGLFDGDEEERLDWLGAALAHGFHSVDLEYDSAVTPELEGADLIRSRHVFSPGGAADAAALIEPVDGAPGAVSKLALHVEDTPALVSLLRWMEHREPPRPAVVIGMGEFGRLSRLVGGWLGSAWDYVSIDGEAAPGQFPLSEAKSLYRLDRRVSTPALYGVLGNPLEHSLSPRLHNALFAHYGIEALYLPCVLTEVGSWAAYLGETRLPFQGFSVTLPFKNQLEPFIGAAGRAAPFNTLLRRDGAWQALDTDGPGFLRPLEAAGAAGAGSAVVLGAGGVATTVARVLLERGWQVTVAGRRSEAARTLADALGCGWTALASAPPADLCVNATPVGQFPDTDRSPLPQERLEYRIVYDLIYNPVRTRLLAEAAARGIETVSGLEMFIEQAALQFEAWTDIDPDRDVMRAVLRENAG